MKSEKKKKYLLIWDRLGDYHRARWKALQKLIGEENAQTADLGSSDKLYGWQNADQNRYHHTLSSKPVHTQAIWTRAKKFISVTRKNQINVVALAGYGRPEYIAFIIMGRMMGLRIMLFAESWYPGNLLFDKLKGIFLRWFVKGIFVSGVRAERHFNQRLEIPLHKIRKGYSVVDNEHFYAKKRVNIKQADVPLDQPYLLCVARYSEEKNLPFLIMAYKKSAIYRKWRLILIGEGPQRIELQDIIGIDREWIPLMGWIDYDKLPTWYQQANAVVLPSSFEPWGLVVNEALAAGKLVLASNACGCVDDLLSDAQENIFDPYDHSSLVTMLDRVYKNLSAEYSPPTMIEKYSCTGWAENLVRLSWD